MKTPRQLILMLDYYFNHDFTKTLNEIQKKEHPEIFNDKQFIKSFKNEMAQLKKRGVKTLTLLDDAYPEIFKKNFRPPFVIFYTGDLNVLKDAIEHKNYDYIEGPNKFELNPINLVNSKFNIITFGDHKLNLWTDRSADIVRFVPLFTRRLICTRKIKNGDSFLAALETCAAMSGNDIYIVPTIEHSLNNDIINDLGALLLDRKEQLENA